MNAPQSEPYKLLTLKQVCDLIGLSRWGLEDLRNSGNFPKPIYLSESRKSIRWLESEVNAWIEQRMAARSTT